MAFPGGGIAGIIIAVLLLIVILVLWSCGYIVHQAEGIVIERFGRFHRVLQPGLSFIVPIMDSPRSFTWRRCYVDMNKRVRDETITATRVDLRESLFNFVKQEVYSRDTVQLEVRACMPVCFSCKRVVSIVCVV